MLVTHRPMFWQAVGQQDRRVMSVSEEGKQLAPSLTTGRTSSLRFLRERIILRADSALTLAKKTPRLTCLIHRG